MKPLRTILVAFAVVASGPALGQVQDIPQSSTASRDQQIERAKERCQQNRGIDCDTPEGLKEWALQERSREEAIQEGSRHLLPRQSGPAPARH